MRKWVGWGVGAVVVFFVALALLAGATQFLWNGLVPALFHGPTITYLQAAGLLLLSRILLRGGSFWGRGSGWRGERWKKAALGRFSAMTPEERARFREEWRRCGGFPDPRPEEKTAATPTA